MAEQITAEQVEAAESALIEAKAARGTAKSGAKFDAYRARAVELTALRVAFREQEEQAGRRTGFVSGAAAS